MILLLALLLQDPRADLRSKDAQTRAEAIRDLARAYVRDAIPEIAALTADADASVRVTAVLGLYDLGAIEQAPRVRALLKDKDEAVRGEAALTLVAFADKASEGAVRAMLLDDDRAVRRRILEGIPRAAFDDAYVRCLGDSDGTMRKLALDALGQLGQPATFDAVNRLLGDANAFARDAAARNLALVAAKDRLPALLSHKNEVVRKAATLRLAMAGDKAALKGLGERLGEAGWPDVVNRLVAPQAFDKLASTRVPFVKFRAIPLAKVLETITKETGVAIEMEDGLPEGLGERPFGPWSTQIAYRATARDLLSVISGAYLEGSPLAPIAWITTDKGAVRVVPQEKAEVHWREQAARLEPK